MDPKNMELVNMGLRNSSSDSNLPVLKVFLITQKWTVSPHRQHNWFRLRVLILLENIFFGATWEPSFYLSTFSLNQWDDAVELSGIQQEHEGSNPLALTSFLHTPISPFGWQRKTRIQFNSPPETVESPRQKTALALDTQPYTQTDRSNCTWELSGYTRRPDGCLSWQGTDMELDDPAILFCKDCFCLCELLLKTGPRHVVPQLGLRAKGNKYLGTVPGLHRKKIPTRSI